MTGGTGLIFQLYSNNIHLKYVIPNFVIIVKIIKINIDVNKFHTFIYRI